MSGCLKTSFVQAFFSSYLSNYLDILDFLLDFMAIILICMPWGRFAEGRSWGFTIWSHLVLILLTSHLQLFAHLNTKAFLKRLWTIFHNWHKKWLFLLNLWMKFLLVYPYKQIFPLRNEFGSKYLLGCYVRNNYPLLNKVWLVSNDPISQRKNVTKRGQILRNQKKLR